MPRNISRPTRVCRVSTNGVAPAARAARISSTVNSSGTSIMSSKDAVALFQLGGIFHEQLRQFGVTRIGHNSASKLIYFFELSS